MATGRAVYRMNLRANARASPCIHFDFLVIAFCAPRLFLPFHRGMNTEMAQVRTMAPLAKICSQCMVVCCRLVHD
jgi:hypothetical protein